MTRRSATSPPCRCPRPIRSPVAPARCSTAGAARRAGGAQRKPPFCFEAARRVAAGFAAPTRPEGLLTLLAPDLVVDEDLLLFFLSDDRSGGRQRLQAAAGVEDVAAIAEIADRVGDEAPGI